MSTRWPQGRQVDGVRKGAILLRRPGLQRHRSDPCNNAPGVAVAGGALLFVGFGQAGFSIMQATLVYLLAPPEVRTRVLGLLSVCIGIGPVGFVALGLVADWLGATAACALPASRGCSPWG